MGVSLSAICLCTRVALVPAVADVSGLVACKDSPAFKTRFKDTLDGLDSSLSNYEVGTPGYDAIKDRIERTKERFNKYGKQGLLCGNEGLPHLIADGRLDRAGEFLLPGLLFIYIAGWIGSSGRFYLAFSSLTPQPSENEIFINLPVAVLSMCVGCLWPFSVCVDLMAGTFVENKVDLKAGTFAKNDVDLMAGTLIENDDNKNDIPYMEVGIWYFVDDE
jgi:photosystem I subunit 3